MSEDLYTRMDHKRLLDKLFTLDCPKEKIKLFDGLSLSKQVQAFTALINMYEANGKKWSD